MSRITQTPTGSSIRQRMVYSVEVTLELIQDSHGYIWVLRATKGIGNRYNTLFNASFDHEPTAEDYAAFLAKTVVERTAR